MVIFKNSLFIKLYIFNDVMVLVDFAM